ncbi:hypothetical protein ACIBKX_30520 [Streptomyces sp. NPDC050658]|uniref:hypothetical protein n=1 Tax=unclassified Streptomyces TaxID=2593676 RepID=UPI003416D9B8
MTGSTPPRKRRFRKRGADEATAVPDGVRDDERGSSPTGTASLEPANAFETAPDEAAADKASGTRTGRTEESRTSKGRRVAAVAGGVKAGVLKSGRGAKAGIGYLADRIIENAPRVPIRDLATLRKQFPGLDPEQLADKLIAGAANATSTVGAGVGAAAMLPVPPAMPAELAAEITGVAAIELKLIAELHEVYGKRPPGNLKDRSTAYLTAWTEERGIDVAKPASINAALGSQMKRELRQQIMKRMVRNLPNLMPFMVGAAVGAVMNRRDTKKLAERVRKDLRKAQVSWDALPELPPLEQPLKPLKLLKPLDPLWPGGRAKELGR